MYSESQTILKMIYVGINHLSVNLIYYIAVILEKSGKY